jgi:hypothetical protein
MLSRWFRCHGHYKTIYIKCNTETIRRKLTYIKCTNRSLIKQLMNCPVLIGNSCTYDELMIRKVAEP